MQKNHRTSTNHYRIVEQFIENMKIIRPGNSEKDNRIKIHSTLIVAKSINRKIIQMKFHTSQINSIRLQPLNVAREGRDS